MRLNTRTVEMCQVRSTLLVLYDEWIDAKKRNTGTTRNFKERKTYSGTLSHHAKKRLTKAVELLVMSAKEVSVYNRTTFKEYKHRLSFVTLTIPDNKKVEGKEGYAMLLKPFLKYFQKRGMFKTYVWKAELQKRGQLHYHITTHTYIEKEIIREVWNNLLRKADLLNGHENPPSTEIKEVKAIKDLASYLVKYIGKSSEEQIGGKVWGCSENLQGKRYYKTEVDRRMSDNIEEYTKRKEARVIRGERCTIIKGKDVVRSCLSGYVKNDMRNYLNSITLGVEPITYEKENDTTRNRRNTSPGIKPAHRTPRSKKKPAEV